MVCYKGSGTQWDENDRKGCETSNLISNKVNNAQIVFHQHIFLHRIGLTKHPLDLRGSRRALEAAKIFLEVDGKKEKFSFLDTTLIIPKTSPAEDTSTLVCPTVACQWLTSKFLKILSLFVSHPNTIPLLFVFFSFVVWLYDCVTDMVIIELLWNFRLPIM